MVASKLILGYHGVEDDRDKEARWIVYGQRRYNLTELSVRRSLFEKQLAYLKKKGYRPVSLKDLQKPGLKGRNVAITFDDGFRNFFTAARPLLQKHGYTATIFPVAGKIGTEYFLSWDEIIELRNQGFSFGAHTCSHSSLTFLPGERAAEEVLKSKKILEEKLNAPVEFFSYPYGDFNPQIQALVKNAGFLGAVVTPGRRGLRQGPYAMKRVGVNRNNSMLVFKLKVSRLFGIWR